MLDSSFVQQQHQRLTISPGDLNTRLTYPLNDLAHSNLCVTSEMPTTTLADYFLDRLAGLGVECLFGVPGDFSA